MNQAIIEKAVRLSLEEDIGSGDITAELIPKHQQALATITANEPGVLCGVLWVEKVFAIIDSAVSIEWEIRDGQSFQAKTVVAQLKGAARSLVSGERAALNWLQTLSGTATQVASYLSRLKSLKVKLLDTRKTIPGLRYAQKYAVCCGGGVNHRMGLYDAFLIKENHILACGSIKAAIEQARKNHPAKSIEVEVENLDELNQALSASADIILLDNFDLDLIRQAVSINHARAKLEVSGGVSLDSIAEVAKTGVDYISVGALTKHVRAIDFSMRIVDVLR